MFFFKSKCNNCADTVLGNSPVNSFQLNTITFKDGSFMRPCGMDPVSRFELRSRVCKKGRVEKEGGMGPVKRLLVKEMTRRLVS